MKLSVNLKDLSFANKLKGNVGILLWGFLGLIALMVGWVIFREISRVKLSQPDNAIAQNQVVRIDQGKHQEMQNLQDDNAHFLPRAIPHAEVFSAPPVQKQSQ